MAESVYRWAPPTSRTYDSARHDLARSHRSHYWQLTMALPGAPRARAWQGGLTGCSCLCKWSVTNKKRKKNSSVNKGMWLHRSGLSNSTWTVDGDILSLQWFIAFYIILCLSFFFFSRLSGFRHYSFWRKTTHQSTCKLCCCQHL